MPRYELDSKAAIVTGSGQGIGRAIALRLAREGAAVIVNDLSGDRAASVVREIENIGGRALPIAGDVSKSECGQELVDGAVEAFGHVDILVNNAGVGAAMPLLDTDEDTWDSLMRVNAKGVLLCSQAGARRMIEQGEGGRIINNASGAGKIAPGRDHPFGAYAASKHAVVALTKQFGLELAPHGILVNCVCAGIVDTAMWDLVDRQVAQIEGLAEGAVKRRAVESIPLGRIQQPEDVANMVAFLASDDADYITATALNVCGGLLPY
jgi:meso-butanediol dehydrogenase / (S,S)-butanediol dehydrogenase / diacetyl reductase